MFTKAKSEKSFIFNNIRLHREWLVMHEHPPGLVVFLTDANFTFTYPDGRTEHIEAKAGQFLWFPERWEHLPESLSDTGFEAIYVDLKP